MQLYSTQTVNLTTCGATGPFGPALANCTAAYASTAWASVPGVFSFGKPFGASVDMWQVLVLPQAGTYTITAAGASNGVLAPTTSLNGGAPCRGAVVTTTVVLPYNTSLYVAIGQMGTCAAPSRSCFSDSAYVGGGGGTFVLLANGSALVAAGGGGGWYWPPSGSWAQCDGQLSSTSGGSGHSPSGDATGGADGSSGSAVYAGAGLFSTNGATPGDYGATFALSVLKGGDGAYTTPWMGGDRNGGFGGGGFSGGGGGYSGGAGSNNAGSWICGGGGSYCIQGLASCVANSYNLGDGYVSISRLSPPSTTEP